MPPYDNNAADATMERNPHLRIEKETMRSPEQGEAAVTAAADEGDDNLLVDSGDDDDDDDTNDAPSTPPRFALHKGALAGLRNEKLFTSKRGDEQHNDFYMRPKEVSSEPRLNCRQRAGSDNCLPSRCLFTDGDYEDEDELEPLEITMIGLRQRKQRHSSAPLPSPAFLLSPESSQQRPDSPTSSTASGGTGEDDETVRRQGGGSLHLRPRSRWIISSEHWLKVLWDIGTVILSIAHAHATHVAIGKRNFSDSYFHMFCTIWFFVDIMLNFITERKTAEGVVLRDYRSICAKYLTSWFAVDALSLLPWESVYVQPIFEIQKRRGFFQKSFFRSKAVVRVTRKLRGKHVRWFGTAAKHAKQHGVGANRLLRLVIKYLPKYILFFRNMKGVVVFRGLRFLQWWRRFYRNIILRSDEKDSMTGSLTRDDYEDDLTSNGSLGNNDKAKQRVRVVYEGWEQLEDDYEDDDDDGVPL